MPRRQVERHRQYRAGEVEGVHAAAVPDRHQRRIEFTRTGIVGEIIQRADARGVVAVGAVAVPGVQLAPKSPGSRRRRVNAA